MMADRLYNAPFPQETIEKMEQVLEQMKQLHKEEYRKVFELDNKFHEAILDLVSFMRLKKAWEDLNYGNIVMGIIWQWTVIRLSKGSISSTKNC